MKPAPLATTVLAALAPLAGASAHDPRRHLGSDASCHLSGVRADLSPRTGGGTGHRRIGAWLAGRACGSRGVPSAPARAPSPRRA